MKQIANLTVIRGNGGCEAYMNGIVKDEIRRQQELLKEQHAAEANRASAIEARRDRLLTERLAELSQKVNRRPNLLQRLWGPVVNSWAMFWALVLNAGEIFLAWCVKHDLVEVVEDWDA